PRCIPDIDPEEQPADVFRDLCIFFDESSRDQTWLPALSPAFHGFPISRYPDYPSANHPAPPEYEAKHPDKLLVVPETNETLSLSMLVIPWYNQSYVLHLSMSWYFAKPIIAKVRALFHSS